MEDIVHHLAASRAVASMSNSLDITPGQRGEFFLQFAIEIVPPAVLYSLPDRGFKSNNRIFLVFEPRINALKILRVRTINPAVASTTTANATCIATSKRPG